jgi:Uma2 family endonuclease
MTQTMSKLITFNEFLEWKPEHERYELHRGAIVKMPNPTGKHEEVIELLHSQLFLESHRLQLPYRLLKGILVKPIDQDTGYYPDLLVVKREALTLEPLWAKSSTIIQGASIALAIEVVSTNWRDDYAHKMTDYEALGIPEYWIVDYLGLGGNRYIGTPKQPTLSICNLVDGEYQIKLFRGNTKIESLVFPELDLTTDQVFNG